MKSYLFSMRGRITRLDYWKAVIGLLVLGGVLSYIVPRVVPGVIIEGDQMSVTGAATVPLAILSLVYFVLTTWIGLCVSGKRCHDRNRSAWFMLVPLIPLVGAIWYLVELGFLRGTVGPNRFGPDPLSPETLGSGFGSPLTSA